MGRRDIVTKHVMKLEELYNDHRNLEYAQDLVTRIMTTSDNDLQNNLFQKFDKLDEERVGYILAAKIHTGRPSSKWHISVVTLIGMQRYAGELLETKDKSMIV